MEHWSDISTVNIALKTLCREFGVERDRHAVLQIATLLMRLSKQGIHEADELVVQARKQIHIVAGSGTAIAGDAADVS